VYGEVPPEAEAVKLTAKGAWPEVGVPEAVMVSAGGETLIAVGTLAEAVWLAESVTARVAVKLPEVE
jgi:hypothetical protein